MNIIESLQWRYATKTFDSNAILEQEKIEALKEAFNLTATSYGLQPIKLLILKNKALQKKLVKAFHGSRTSSTGVTCFGFLY